MWDFNYFFKAKLHFRTGHEGTEGLQIFISTIPLNSAIDGRWW